MAPHSLTAAASRRHGYKRRDAERLPTAITRAVGGATCFTTKTVSPASARIQTCLTSPTEEKKRQPLSNGEDVAAFTITNRRYSVAHRGPKVGEGK